MRNQEINWERQEFLHRIDHELSWYEEEEVLRNEGSDTNSENSYGYENFRTRDIDPNKKIKSNQIYIFVKLIIHIKKIRFTIFVFLSLESAWIFIHKLFYKEK